MSSGPETNSPSRSPSRSTNQNQTRSQSRSRDFIEELYKLLATKEESLSSKTVEQGKITIHLKVVNDYIKDYQVSLTASTPGIKASTIKTLVERINRDRILKVTTENIKTELENKKNNLTEQLQKIGEDIQKETALKSKINIYINLLEKDKPIPNMEQKIKELGKIDVSINTKRGKPSLSKLPTIESSVDEESPENTPRVSTSSYLFEITKTTKGGIVAKIYENQPEVESNPNLPKLKEIINEFNAVNDIKKRTEGGKTRKYKKHHHSSIFNKTRNIK
jgi:hypothetical protein